MPAFWTALARFDRQKIQPWMALRNSLAVVLTLAIGVLAGSVSSGTVAALGALNVSYSDGSDPYAHRARRMLTASGFCALAVLTGGLSARYHAIAIAIACGCAFAAGMMAAVNQTAADIGVMTLVSLVVFSAQAMDPQKAVNSALLALGGGVLETALALVLWPFRRYAPERSELAILYRELARAASAGAPVTEAPPGSDSISRAHAVLTALQADGSVEADRYLALLSQAERLRLTQLALFRASVRLSRESATAHEVGMLRRISELAAGVLEAVAESLEGGTPCDPRRECLRELDGLAGKLRELSPENPSPDVAAVLADARWQVDALAGQLRSAIELAGHVSPAGAAEFERGEFTRPWTLRLGGAWARLRANLRLDSPVFRHALRLAICVGAGDLIGRSLEWRRSYWITMTIAIILKPDYTATLSRGLLRLSGTLVGLGLATALLHFLSPPPAVDVVLIGVFTFGMRSWGAANYGVFAVAVTAMVVLLIGITGTAPGPVIAARGLNTVLGGVIAIAAYRLWPTWEIAQVPEALAGLLDGYREYLQVIRDAYLEPERSFAGELDRARRNARLCRSRVEASLARLATEPGVPAVRLHRVHTVLANTLRLIHAAMSLEAGLSRSRPVPARPPFRDFANHVDLTLYLLAAALRGSAVNASDLPDLREDHRALLHAGDPAVERYALVNIETDRITNSLNTMALEIFQLLGEA